MHFSTITDKGQTTIPREIREYLDLKPQDKIVYVPDGKKIYLTLVRGSILDIKGIVKKENKKPQDFHKLREQIKRKISKENLKEMK